MCDGTAIICLQYDLLFWIYFIQAQSKSGCFRILQVKGCYFCVVALCRHLEVVIKLSLSCLKSWSF